MKKHCHHLGHDAEIYQYVCLGVFSALACATVFYMVKASRKGTASLRRYKARWMSSALILAYAIVRLIEYSLRVFSESLCKQDANIPHCISTSLLYAVGEACVYSVACHQAHVMHLLLATFDRASEKQHLPLKSFVQSFNVFLFVTTVTLVILFAYTCQITRRWPMILTDCVYIGINLALVAITSPLVVRMSRLLYWQPEFSGNPPAMTDLLTEQTMANSAEHDQGIQSINGSRRSHIRTRNSLLVRASDGSTSGVDPNTSSAEIEGKDHTEDGLLTLPGQFLVSPMIAKSCETNRMSSPFVAEYHAAESPLPAPGFGGKVQGSESDIKQTIERETDPNRGENSLGAIADNERAFSASNVTHEELPGASSDRVQVKSLTASAPQYEVNLEMARASETEDTDSSVSPVQSSSSNMRSHSPSPGPTKEAAKSTTRIEDNADPDEVLCRTSASLPSEKHEQAAREVSGPEATGIYSHTYLGEGGLVPSQTTCPLQGGSSARVPAPPAGLYRRPQQPYSRPRQSSSSNFAPMGYLSPPQFVVTRVLSLFRILASITIISLLVCAGVLVDDLVHMIKTKEIFRRPGPPFVVGSNFTDGSNQTSSDQVIAVIDPSGGSTRHLDLNPHFVNKRSLVGDSSQGPQSAPMSRRKGFLKRRNLIEDWEDSQVEADHTGASTNSSTVGVSQRISTMDFLIFEESRAATYSTAFLSEEEESESSDILVNEVFFETHSIYCLYLYRIGELLPALTMLYILYFLTFSDIQKQIRAVVTGLRSTEDDCDLHGIENDLMPMAGASDSNLTFEEQAVESDLFGAFLPEVSEGVGLSEEQLGYPASQVDVVR